MHVRGVFLALLLVFLPEMLFGGIKSALDAIKVISIKSSKQKVIDKNYVIFENDVEVLLDYKVHIVAQKVEFDKKNQIITAYSKDGSFVKLENPDFVMLAQYIELNLEEKTGSAKHLKIHVKDGFLSSSFAQKIDDQTWKMDHITYTSCDRTVPHWAFIAHKAILYKNSVLKASGLLFKIKGVPVFAFPGLVFPLQKRAGSGFLIPRLSYDPELGFGFKQEYYWWFGEQCDTTMGFHLVEKKGFILSNEFRWAKSPQNYMVLNGCYAEEWDALLERRGRIISATDQRYWVKGNYFQPILDFQTLIRFDFGTDKRIGYHFTNDAQGVEDSFYNTIIGRHVTKSNHVEFLAHVERSLRRQFVELSADPAIERATNQKQEAKKTVQKEREEKVSVSYAPRFEWNTGYFPILPKLYYRHDLLMDNAFLESRETEKLYVDEYLEQVSKAFPAVNTETARFLYRGRLKSSIKFLNQNITGFIEPHLHLRSNVKKSVSGCSSPRYKAFVRCGVEWALPERVLGKPLIRWTYLPKFCQNHWHHIDKYDRFYPENRVELILENGWREGDFDIDLRLSQGYEFYSKNDIFPLNRCYNQEHLTPFQIFLSCSYNDCFSMHLLQEYSWKSLSLMQSEIAAVFSLNKYDFYLSYLYQKRALQRDRELVSDVPVFAVAGFTVPIGKHIQIHYDGSFYSRDRHAFPGFGGARPLLNRFKFNYDGHCWGVSFGFEEKRYRQYGKWKSERAITLSLSLESIGSFAQRFRRPVIYKAPKDYEG